VTVRLVDEIADADRALGDDGPLEAVLEPSANLDREEIAARGGSPDVEEAIGDQPAAVPSMIEPDPEPHMPSFGSPGGLPKSLATSDEALYGRSFLRNADRKAWRRQMRSAHQ
jgi:hypothetical protein